MFNVIHQMYMQDEKQKAESLINYWNSRRQHVAWSHKRHRVLHENGGTTHFFDKTTRMCPYPLHPKRFAIASMLIDNSNKKDLHFYELGAAKLASSIHMWSPHVLSLVDLVLIIATDNTTMNIDTKLLQNAGWNLCYTTIIASPSNDMKTFNRYLQANLYSKLRMWQLEEYDAVLSIDTDVLVISELDVLLHKYYMFMNQKNFTLAAVGDGLLSPCQNELQRNGDVNFNGGVLLLKPDRVVFSHLISAMDMQSYTKQLAEQSLLNHLYPIGKFYQLPYRFNMQVGNIQCGHRVQDANILHFIGVPKPWSLRRGMFSCAFYDLHCWRSHSGFFHMPLGVYLAGTTHMNLVWEMIPLMVKNNNVVGRVLDGF